MSYLVTWFKARTAERDRGATAVEYGLIVALIAAVIVAVVAFLGDNIREAFQDVCDEVTTQTGQPCS